MLIFSLGVILSSLIISKWCVTKNKTEIFERILGYSIIILWLIYNIYYFSPSNFDWSVSLPLHLCDIASIICGFAVLKQKRNLSAIMYYWSITFALQAFIYPVGDQNPNKIRFWLFWLLHIGILVCALYDLIIKKFHPRFSDYITSIKFGTIYIIIIFPINLLFNWNYGYIGNSKPNISTPIDLIGTWPLRVLWMYLIIVAFQFLLTIPWLFKKQIDRGNLK